MRFPCFYNISLFLMVTIRRHLAKSVDETGKTHYKNIPVSRSFFVSRESRKSRENASFHSRLPSGRLHTRDSDV